VGQHRDLLAYLVRRLLENGANSSFVHQLADESVGMDDLLISPLRLEPDSSCRCRLTCMALTPARRNSLGLDLTVPGMRDPLLAALATAVPSPCPKRHAAQPPRCLPSARGCPPAWSRTPVTERAAILRQAADDAGSRHAALLRAAGQGSAFKTWGDAVAEVREAVDFLRYYANEAERIMRRALPQVHGVPSALAAHSFGMTGESNELRLTARGAWVCISPWNFPLAIFVGQVAAALATGNTVLAKPAEQTPGVAQEAVKLLHAAGVPGDALQLLHGPGETVGAALVAQTGVAGVVFTGSTQVAKIIQRALAAKDGAIVPLIAETGGINAMLVDSTALPEQVADAVVQSAFRSAGQRCSALRLLCVHVALPTA
jgi:RHH-type proline utilization regulon transcriptional repressor/proline dehydrogenase/delta 1-pyrroline-5-carboxylate dehydrogenase